MFFRDFLGCRDAHRQTGDDTRENGHGEFQAFQRQDAAVHVQAEAGDVLHEENKAEVGAELAGVGGGAVEVGGQEGTYAEHTTENAGTKADDGKDNRVGLFLCAAGKGLVTQQHLDAENHDGYAEDDLQQTDIADG